MPLNITPETPRRARTIGAKGVGSVLVQVAAPYAAGMTIGEAEAQMLNQTVAENVSNNLREKIVAYVPPAPADKPYGENNPAPAPRLATVEEAQGLVDTYLAKYEPGVRQGGGAGGARALTPLDKEVRNIATEKLDELLKAQNIKRTQVNFTELRDQIIEEHREALEAQAQTIIRARENAAKKGGDLDLGNVLGNIANGGASTGGTGEQGQTGGEAGQGGGATE